MIYYPNTIHIVLRQHTPLIHFQHAQADATLRATEVKPKLDKFIIAQTEQINGQIPSHWYVGKEKTQQALDYKLQITPTIDKSPKVESIGTFKKDVYGPYFGDASGMTWSEGLTLTVTSFETDVLDAVYQYIVSFFVLHNFGQRQTKGFGSFTVDKVNELSVPSYEAGKQFGTVDVEQILTQYYGVFYKLDSDKYKQDYPGAKTLEQIQNEYQLLKAGKNHGGYEKSKLFEFFISSQPRIRWEKRKIKQEINKKIEEYESFLHPLFKKKNKEYDYSQDKEAENRYVRALLGLAETNEYLINDGITTDKYGQPAASKTEKYMVIIDHKPDSGKESDAIERLSSPILFKVFDNAVYLIPQPINAAIYNQLFQFSVQPKGQSEHKKDLVKLKTPASFDLIAFLDYALLGKGAKKIVWEKIA